MARESGQKSLKVEKNTEKFWKDIRRTLNESLKII